MNLVITAYKVLFNLEKQLGGIYPIVSFPVMLPNDSFVEVVSENSNSIGRHRVVWSIIKGTYNFTVVLRLDFFSH